MENSSQFLKIRSERKDPPCWALSLVAAMLLAVGLLIILPPYLTKNDDDAFFNVKVVVISEPNEASGSKTEMHNDKKNNSPYKNNNNLNSNNKSPNSDSSNRNFNSIDESNHDTENSKSKESSIIPDSETPTTRSILTTPAHGTLTKKANPLPSPSPATSTPPTSDPLLVETSNGLIKGKESMTSKDVRVFYGVPYAQPPVGNLRWKPPTEAVSWKPDVYNATYMRSGCPQKCEWHGYCPRETSEDCLHVQVFTPITATIESKLPVMVYIHGGAFVEVSTASSGFDSTRFVQRTGVIVVLVEYRLGALGFLVHKNEEDSGKVSGNYGVLDQAMALEWVHGNIHAFGGDPTKVTLAGQSAGSESAFIHLQSPTTSNYFRSVILESHPLAFNLKTATEGIKQTKQFYDLTPCGKTSNTYTRQDGDSDETKVSIDFTCLRNLDVDVIVNAQSKVKSFGSGYLSKVQPWGPFVDSTTVPRQALQAFKNSDNSDLFKKPMIWGVTGQEAWPFVISWFSKPTNSLIYSFAKTLLNRGGNRKRFNSLYPATSVDTREDISRIATDLIFHCPLYWGMSKLRDMGVESSWTYLWKKTLSFPESSFAYPCSNMSCHGIELAYVFHNFKVLESNPPSEADIEASDRIENYYGNFIKYGDPNGDPNTSLPVEGKGHGDDSDAMDLYWPKTYAPNEDEENGDYRSLVFHNNGSVSIDDPILKKKCDMWTARDFKVKT